MTEKKENVPRLGESLLTAKVITEENLEFALTYQKATKQPIGTVLVDLGMVDEHVVLDHLMSMLPMEEQVADDEAKHVSKLEKLVDPEVLGLLKSDFCRERMVMPIRLDTKGVTLLVAMTEPDNAGTISDIEQQTRLRVQPLKVPLRELKRLWMMFFRTSSMDNDTFREQAGLETVVNRIAQVGIPAFVNTVMRRACELDASDIHFDTFPKHTLLRFRIDGVLHPVCRIPKEAYDTIVSRIKVMSSMDISEKHMAQEGRIELEQEIQGYSRVDFRVAAIPTYSGERITMRVLTQTNTRMGMAELGLSLDQQQLFLRHLSMRQGMILISGPTGSGKTTTIYSMLNAINDYSRNIITIEDPVEYPIDGLGQIQVNERKGITYHSILKYLLRQNPDVIFVGEIRDYDTAEMAVRAAITGHLIIATMHTNDTSTAITRLIDLGVKPFLLASALRLVISQRLIGTVCPDCKVVVTVPQRDQLRVGLRPAETNRITFFKGEGCSQCAFTGTRGGTGVFEVMPINSPFAEQIRDDVSSATIRSRALKEGMVPLKVSALEKIKSGEVSLYDVLRVFHV